MEDTLRDIGRTARGWLLALIATGLFLSAWGVLLYGNLTVSRLPAAQPAADEDVSDALGREAFTARQLLPYKTAAVILDGLSVFAAVAAIFRAVAHRGPWPLWLFVAMAGILSLSLHLFLWVISWFFAG